MLQDVLDQFDSAVKLHASLEDDAFSFGFVTPDFRLQDVIDTDGFQVHSTVQPPTYDQEANQLVMNMEVGVFTSAPDDAPSTGDYDQWGVTQFDAALEILINILEYVQCTNRDFDTTWSVLTNAGPATGYSIIGFSTVVEIRMDRPLLATNLPTS